MSEISRSLAVTLFNCLDSQALNLLNNATQANWEPNVFL